MKTTARKISRFNKKTFDPSWNNREHRKILDMWRNAGWSRCCAYREYSEIRDGDVKFNGVKATLKNSFYKAERLVLERLRSTAYSHVIENYKPKKGWVLLDAGCGRSPDYRIALEEDGAKLAYRLDLYDVPIWGDDRRVVTNLCDISESDAVVGKGMADIVLCQAVLDLLDASQRDAFYKNAHKWLKKGGILSVYIVNLVLGHGFNLPDEKDAVTKAGFRILKNYGGGFVAQKI